MEMIVWHLSNSFLIFSVRFLLVCDSHFVSIIGTVRYNYKVSPIRNKFTMGLILYKKDTSPPCRAVRMVFHALNLQDIEYRDVNLPGREQYTEEYLKINPQHTIPTLIDGDFIIWDSHAIAAYLVTKYGTDDSLYPKDPKKRAIVDQRLHFDTGVLFATLRATVEPLLYSGEKTFRPESLDRMRSAYDFLEKFLTTPWLAGDEPTLADISCISTISSMNEIVPIDESLYPNITAWWKRCSLQDFYIKGNAPGLLKFQEMMKSKLG